MVWGIATQYLYQILLMALQVLVAPMLLKSDVSGGKLLGGYASLMQFVGYLTLLDLGFSDTLSRYLSKSFYDLSEGRKKFINIFNIGRWYLFSVCFIMGLAIAASSSYFPESIHLRGPLKEDVVHAMLILAMWYCVRFYFTMFNIVLYATQQMKTANICLTIGVVIRFTLVMLFIKFNYGITGIVMANVIGDFSAALLQMIFFKIKYPSIKFSWRIYDKSVFKELFTFGINALLINISTRIVLASTTIISGIMLGTVEAGNYYSMSTSIFIVFTFVNMIMYNLLPSMIEMIATNKMDDFRRTYVSTFKLKMTLLIPAFLGLLLFHQYITVLWVGKAHYEGFYYTIILSFYLIIVTISSYNENVLIILGNIKWYSRLQIISTIIGLLFTIAGGYLWGLKGIVSGNLIAITPVVIYVFLRLLKQINVRFSFFSFMPPIRFIVFLIILTLAIFVLQNKLGKINLKEVLFTALLFILLIFFEGIDKERRLQLSGEFLKKIKR